MNTNPRTFTAAELSAALTMHKRSVLVALRAVPATGLKMVRGQPAQAWEFATLPEPFRQRLSAEATRRGFRDALHLLESPPASWQPAIPLSQCAPHVIEKAAKLQRALQSTFSR